MSPLLAAHSTINHRSLPIRSKAHPVLHPAIQHSPANPSPPKHINALPSLTSPTRAAKPPCHSAPKIAVYSTDPHPRHMNDSMTPHGAPISTTFCVHAGPGHTRAYPAPICTGPPFVHIINILSRKKNIQKHQIAITHVLTFPIYFTPASNPSNQIVTGENTFKSVISICITCKQPIVIHFVFVPDCNDFPLLCPANWNPAAWP
jgi:hypothetical protein